MIIDDEIFNTICLCETYKIKNTIFRFKIDLGRPSFTDDEQRNSWIKFFDYVDDTEIQLKVNGVYRTMEASCKNSESYMGGGFSFCFWFKSIEDRKQFLYDLETKLKWEPYRDCHNIQLHLRLDKKFVLRVNPKLTQIALDYLRMNHTNGYWYHENCNDYVAVDNYDLKFTLDLEKYLNECLLDMDR